MSEQSDYQVHWERRDGTSGDAFAHDRDEAIALAKMYRDSGVFKVVVPQQRDHMPWEPLDEERCS